MTTGRINQVTILAGDRRAPHGGAGWFGEGRHSRPRTIGGRPPLFTRAPPHAVLLPPPSSPGRLPPRGEGASGASPDTQSMGAQGGGHRRPATPQGGCRPWLTPESLAAAMAIGQRPTDLTEAEREPLGLRRP